MRDAHEHYGPGYLGRERWMSYVYQLDGVRDISPSSALEIGVGAGALRSMLEVTYPGCDVVTVDIEASLRPRVCANVEQLPFADRQFDAVFCCQVLEHLPFHVAVRSLCELRRVARRRVIVSLPDVRPFFFLRARGSRRILPPFWRGISVPNPLERPIRFEEHGQHHWEIGRPGYPLKCIVAAMRDAGLRLQSHFRMTERSYWHFFILEPIR
jgi:hypothetical protein